MVSYIASTVTSSISNAAVVGDWDGPEGNQREMLHLGEVGARPTEDVRQILKRCWEDRDVVSALHPTRFRHEIGVVLPQLIHLGFGLIFPARAPHPAVDVEVVLGEPGTT
jgi:hypothetical protein